MNRLLTFFGQILRRGDVDFQQSSNREAIVQTHISLTDGAGGIIEGLNVLPSSDGKSILVTPGIFYTKGNFNDKNNIGGGERGELFSALPITGLPQTEPISNQPSFLLVYAKIINSNVNPNPTQSQNVATSKNILTGQNQPIRNYSQASIVVSNPILKSEVSKFNGIPLALLTVDYDEEGLQKSTNGAIQSITTEGIRKAYIIGGTVDLLNNSLTPDSINDGLIVNRMVAEGTLEGSKFATDSVGSNALAQWDGTTGPADITGDGIATPHLKNGAVTAAKLNYSGSMAGFNTRNRLQNSSFEISTTGNVNIPNYWDLSVEGFSEIRTGLHGADSFPVKNGIRSIIFNGGSQGDPATALELSITQTVDFEGDLTGKPLSPFFWAQINQISEFAISGTTGLQGKIELLNNENTIVGSPYIFATVTGNSTGWIQYSNPSGPIVYSGTGAPSQVRYTIGGAFGGSYYVDGAFLGMTDIVPEFDIKPSEFVDITEFEGQITTVKIEDGAINTRKILLANGQPSTDLGAGIISSQIRPGAIVTSLIADNAITAAKISPDAGLIPKGGILLWDSGTTCPAGFIRVSELDGRFPLGANAETGVPNAIINTQISGGDKTFGSNPTSDGFIQKTNNGTAEYVHNHATPRTNRSFVGPGNSNDPFIAFDTTSNDGGHTHNIMLPYYTLIFCRKLD